MLLIKASLLLLDIENKFHHNPKKILRLDENYGNDSYLEINLNKEHIIKDNELLTKANGVLLMD